MRKWMITGEVRAVRRQRFRTMSLRQSLKKRDLKEETTLT